MKGDDVRKLLMSVTALLGLVTVGLVAGPTVNAGAAVSTAIYDSTLSPLPGNLASQCFECSQVSEIGNQVAFSSGSPRVLDDVVVTMSSWGCESVVAGICTTTPGSTFNQPLTLNLYNVGAGNTVGSLIKTVTQTFAIPYRPSTDNVNCGPGTAWWDSAAGPAGPATCDHGLATNVTFNFGHTTLPDKVIYGIVSNTSDYGPNPYGAQPCQATPQKCGYDALNVGLTTETPSPAVGSDPVQNALYDSSVNAPFYCDGGTSGVGNFRLDQGCWGVDSPYTSAPYYVPSVRFDAVVSPAPSIYTSASVTTGTPVNFTVATTGVPVPALTHSKKLPAGLTFTDNGNGTATIAGTPAGGTYSLKIKAVSTAGTATQNLTLVVNQIPAFTNAATKTVKAGHAFTVNVRTTGYPVATITSSGLPAGVTLVPNGSGRAILSGTVAAAGTYHITLTATNAAGVVNQPFVLTIN